MKRKIGEIFSCNGKWYQCLQGSGCHKCDFNIDENTCGIENPYCTGRSDKKDVIFKKLEKVGEPYSDYCPTGRTIHFQRYRCYQKPIIEGDIVWHWPDDNFIDIEIKQNKEDMEEKTIKIKKEDIKVGSKVTCLSNNRPYVITEANCRMKYDGDWHDCVIYTPLYDNPYKCFVRPIKDFAQNFVLDSAEEKEEKHSNLENTEKNLKPFNLEAAKAGKPVCTRDGRKARIICFDAKGNKPLIILSEIDGKEVILRYTEKGQSDSFHSPTPREDDLMMLSEKKEGWVNVYDADTTFRFVEGMVYNTKDEAIQRAKEEVTNGQREKNEYVDTVKICWEE